MDLPKQIESSDMNVRDITSGDIKKEKSESFLTQKNEIRIVNKEACFKKIFCLTSDEWYSRIICKKHVLKKVGKSDGKFARRSWNGTVELCTYQKKTGFNMKTT